MRIRSPGSNPNWRDTALPPLPLLPSERAAALKDRPFDAAVAAVPAAARTS